MKQDYFFEGKTKASRNEVIYIIIILLLVCSFFIFFEFYIKNMKNELIAKDTKRNYYSMSAVKNTVRNKADSEIVNIENPIKSLINYSTSNVSDTTNNFVAKLDEEPEIEQILEEPIQVQKMIPEEVEQVTQQAIQEQIQIQKTEQVQTIEITAPQQNIEINTYVTPSGESYSIIGNLSIPKLGIENSILSETSPELLNIALNKFWGANPNEMGNMVIAGHNYRDDSTRGFSRLHNIQIGDIVKITDTAGRMLDYVVYDTYIVDPYDLSCTSQLTDGKTEITLITCYNKGTQRFIVKARAY